MTLLRRLKGYPGHPSHPPLTDVSIGAYTTAVFALSWFPGRAGYEDGRVHATALILALAGEALLLAGSYLGGALVYVHGHRVLSQPQAPVGEALLPGRPGWQQVGQAGRQPGQHGCGQRRTWAVRQRGPDLLAGVRHLAYGLVPVNVRAHRASRTPSLSELVA
jgi:hypothetical protein